MQVCLLFATLIAYYFDSGSSVRLMCITLLLTLSTIYPISASLLFVVLCYASSHTFQFIQTEIKRFNESMLVKNRYQKLLLLTSMKNLHILACDTVDAINYSLGSALLLSTVSLFLSIINSSFFFFGRNKFNSLPDIIFTFVDIIHLTSISCVSDHLQNKVSLSLTIITSIKR